MGRSIDLPSVPTIFSCSRSRVPWQSSLGTSVALSAPDTIQAALSPVTTTTIVSPVPLPAPRTQLCFMKFAKSPTHCLPAPPEEVEHPKPYGLTKIPKDTCISPLADPSLSRCMSRHQDCGTIPSIRHTSGLGVGGANLELPSTKSLVRGQICQGQSRSRHPRHHHRKLQPARLGHH